MKILDRYIITKIFGVLLFVLFIFSMVAIIFDISEKIDNMLVHKAPVGAIIFQYYKNFIPFLILLLLPLFVFISVIFFTSRMASRNEIIAILGSGVSFWRFLMPYIAFSMLVAVVQFFLAGYLLPPASVQRKLFEDKYIKGSYYNTNRNVHLKTEKGYDIYVETFNNTDTSGYRFAAEKIDNGFLTYKIIGERIDWNEKKQLWQIDNYYIRTIDGRKETLQQGKSIDSSFGFTPKDFDRPLEVDFSLLNNDELAALIVSENKKGRQTIQLEVEKHKRISNPSSTFILVLMGVALSSKKSRGGIGVQLGLGIALSFVYILIIQFSTVFATKGGLNPMFAAWIPNFIFAVVALLLLFKAPK